MKTILFLSLVLSSYTNAQTFESEAKQLAQQLKTSLMSKLSEQVVQNGVANAIPFCHENVKPIAKQAAGIQTTKYEFGRTSHKIRNENNNPIPWMKIYLKEFDGKYQGDLKKEFIIHQLESGKKVYLEPLFVQAQCLLCHGENISQDVKDKLKKTYPQDQATGFKLNEFRGFIWVREK